ncbi:hypothetical protein [Metabacillus fastidiosus]|uniref:hypothetical protein n=1 Tax=Metabacillus fastidiosus TaxID=1458 RepID=UPI003D267C69
MAYMLRQFEYYVDQEEINFLEDGVGFSQAKVYLTKKELQQFGMDLAAAMAKMIHNESNEEPNAINIASIFYCRSKSKERRLIYGKAEKVDNDYIHDIICFYKLSNCTSIYDGGACTSPWSGHNKNTIINYDDY